MGIKPLYYWSWHGRWTGICIGDQGVLCVCLALPPNSTAARCGQFLEFGYTFDTDRTSLEGVRKLPPGHIVRLTLETPRRSRLPFYVPNVRGAAPASMRDADADTMRMPFARVVRQHLIADVPVGLLLSGGLQFKPPRGASCPHDEGPNIRWALPIRSSTSGPCAPVARHIGSDHEEVLITPEEVQTTFGEQSRVRRSVCRLGNNFHPPALCKCRERGIKVVIVGEGADELFGGYDVFRSSASRRRPSCGYSSSIATMPAGVTAATTAPSAHSCGAI